MGEGEQRRRPIAAVLVALVALVLVVFIGGDIVTRAFVEARIRTGIVAQLPDGLAGDVNVRVGGAPMLLQFVSGSFTQVTVVSKGMLVRGIPFQSTVVVSNVPFDPAKPISRVTATVSLSDEAATALSALPGAVTVAFGDGTIVYRMPGQTTTGAPESAATAETTTSAATTSGAATASVTPAVSADGTSVVLATKGSPTDADQAASVSVCIAKFLPAGIHLTSITPTVGSLSMTVEGDNVSFSRSALAVAGTCP
ncbi:LmeA family phospholipid-binding protein [Subtercola endophyticus]|uniref:LmeA family phospholipid-binding protein n=1 Tax=Subtercola endophyticus TaxID=2895559 RepID=UPI001E3600E4|nr:DUF2993 domain-containing protein [Subtercola endophyticus]UFS60037.1 DUF2993 domain-containing protein [Subtercola endophyticus]